jgi:DNA polymerase I
VKIIRTHEMDPTALTDFEREMTYNGLDCCVTRDVLDAMLPQLDPISEKTYSLSRALQGPTLEMRCRGVLVDQSRKMDVIDEYYQILERLEVQLERIVFEGIGLLSFNWRSPRDLQRLFYEELGISPIRRSGRPTVDRAARERLEVYPIAQQLIKHINALTEIGDKISVLKTAIDPDGRIRTSYNIAGTSTGRFSSSFSEFGTGGNLQNVEESLRSIFVADPGYKFAKCDAKSGESFCVGAIEWNLFRDGRYLDACESGDPHTAVARMCWGNLPWTGDLKKDQAIAKLPYYRQLSYRDMCKKLGHGSNYGGQPKTLSEVAKVDLDLVQQFQPKYFTAFPSHQLWHAEVDNTLRRKGFLISLLGRRRHFFGRRNDPKTLREAIAYDPQSSLRDIVSTALLRIWRANYTIIAMDDHDALTFMYPEHLEDEIIPRLMSDLVVEVPLEGGRSLRIPYDCETGWNKGKFDAEKNPNGLKEYHGHDNRTRQASPGILDRIICRTNRKPARA